MPTTMTPARTMNNRPAQMNINTDQLLRRDVFLDAQLLRDLRRDGFASQNYGRNPYGQLSGYGGYGASGYSMGYGGYGPPASGTMLAKSSPNPASTTEEAARAALTTEQVIAERLANRRRAFDELIYEREKTLSPEQELLNRSRTTPGPGEVASGEALNALLVQLRRTIGGMSTADRHDIALPFGEVGLKHINVTRGSGNIAIFKDHRRVNWPAALTDATYQELRERLDVRAAEAVRQLTIRGSVDSHDIRQMTIDVERLRQLLQRSAMELSLQPYIEAKTFLRNLDDAIFALQQPDAANHFTGVYELKATSVLGLVNHMTQNALRFAPALPGDEAFYSVLREILAACDPASLSPPK